MSDHIAREQALILFERAYRRQMRGEWADAIHLYKRSLTLHPTAMAFTFLGWTYSMLDRYDEAIAYCHKAIELDETLGNPYNDIGAYLIEQGKHESAIPWLEKAIAAPNYENPEFAHTNLGRVYGRLGKFREAIDCFDRALAINPYYRSAIWAKYSLLSKLN
jgi:tetratricopeptide (TPR) repeat protein